MLSTACRGAGFSLRWLLLIPALALMNARAEDWPEWRGQGRLGVWNETGILETFPANGLAVTWRAPVAAGYSGPAVANGRVFVTGFRKGTGTAGIESVLCLDERTGRQLWTQEWNTDYRGLDYPTGPRATPTVDDDRVYTLGAMGLLHCLDVKTGRIIWKRDFVAEFATRVPAWGMAGAPIVDGNRLIAIVAGSPNAKVAAFDKQTGKEIWRALSSDDSEPGYSQPILIQAGGMRQLIVWHATAIHSLDPASGKILWDHPFRIHMNTPIATPVYAPPHLLVSGFFNGARLLQLATAKPEASLVWRGMIDSEIRNDTLHALMASPVVQDGFIYGICSYGQLRCLRLDTGERVWETQEVTRERARNVSAFLVRNGDRCFIQNDRGELIIARLSPEGYQEISRTSLIKPTSPPGARRELGAVNWAHPAFANRHIFARNDEEVISVSLAR